MVNDSFKALSHPIRRGIVEQLATGPATVAEATSGFGVSKPAISKHLKVLEEAGVVSRVVEGRTHRLSLELDGLREAAEWMDRQRALWGRMFDVVDDYLKEEAAEVNTPPIVSPQEWESARERLLVKEKEATRARDALAAERRRMPWMAVEKEYRFEGPDGPASLLDLFEGRRQLVVYRAFYGPEVTTCANGTSYPERGCVGCSFVADQVANPVHLNARDTTLAFVSRAPQAEIQALQQRNGMGADPLVLAHRRLRHRLRRRRVARDERVHQTRASGSTAPTSSTPAGDEHMGSTWSYLDITALGRQEEWEDSPEGYPQTPPYGWWNYTTPTARPRDRPYRRGAGRGAVPDGDRTGGGHAAGARMDTASRATPRRAAEMTTKTQLRMRRTFDAPAERVFDAWTSEEVMRRWWHAERDWETSEASVELRVGGEVRVVMRDPHEGAEYGGGGEYTVVDPPRRLAFTWTWDHEPERGTLIEIEFEEAEGRTTVNFTHNGLWSEEVVRSHEGGWNRCFDNLERQLS